MTPVADSQPQPPVVAMLFRHRDRRQHDRPAAAASAPRGRPGTGVRAHAHPTLPTDGRHYAIDTPLPWRSRALSLLEVLVSTGVIALLASILLPAMSGAREKGRLTNCIGILHNAGVAATLYLEENEGTFWPYYADLVSPECGRQWWFGLEPDGPPSNPWQTNRPILKEAGFLSRYLAGAAEDLICPSFPYPDSRYFPKFSPHTTSYGYNLAALAVSSGTNPSATHTGHIREFVGQTADVFVLADGIHFDRLDFSNSPSSDQTLNEPAYIQWQDPAFFNSNAGVQGGFGHFRHGGRAAVLFIDGHVGTQPVRRSPHPYSRYGCGPVANLSDDLLRTVTIKKGNRLMAVDVIYGLRP